MSRKFEIKDAVGGVAFTVRVVTRAVKTEMAGMQDDGVLKVRLKATPAGDPAANQELREFLAERLDVPVEKIEIVAGESGRDKLVTVEGLMTDDVEAKLTQESSED